MAWLMGIAQHIAIDSLRYRDKHPKCAHMNWMEDEDGYAKLHASEPQPLDSVIQTRTGDAVRRALDVLSIHQRESLRLFFYEGFSHGEIAARFDGRSVRSRAG